MSFLDLAAKRYSVRGYQPDPVPDEVLRDVLEAARLAPTAANRQPFKLIVIDNPQIIGRFEAVYPAAWLRSAPVVIVLCIDPQDAWIRNRDRRSYVEVDAAIVMDHLTLAAADAGLGTCWIAAFNPEPLWPMLNIPPHMEPYLITPLGYPAVEPGAKRRKDVSELVMWNIWGGKNT